MKKTKKGRIIHKLELTNFMDVAMKNHEPVMVIHSDHDCPEITGFFQLTAYNPKWDKMSFKMGRGYFVDIPLANVQKCDCFVEG